MKFQQPTEAPTMIVPTRVFQFKCFTGTALPGATRRKMIQCEEVLDQLTYRVSGDWRLQLIVLLLCSQGIIVVFQA